MPKMPFEFQKRALLKVGEKLASEQKVDPVYASEALDFLDSTLTYEENKRIYFEELERRGIRTVPVEAKAKEEFEHYLGEVLFREVPGLEEYIGEIRTEATVAETELGKLKERHTKLREETKRWKELSEAERAKLTSELDEIKRGLETLLGGLPRPWVEELMVVFMKLPKASEEAFWTWLKENLDLAKRQYEAKVLAASLEPHMKEYLEKKPAPPPKPVVVRPEPKYKIGEEAFDLETGRKIIVRQQLYNELTKKYDYLVDDRGRIKRISEDKIVSLPPLPPPAARPPRAPAVPRAPPAPRLVEFTCPKCGRPLEPITEISWTERVPVMEKPEEYLPEVFTGRYTEKWYTRRIPEAELVFMCMAGMGDEIKALMAELAIPGITEKDRETLTKMIIELEERMKAVCPYGGMYFKVRRGVMIGPVAKSEVVRQVLAPPPAPRRVTPRGQIMEEVAKYERGIEIDPEFRKFVEEEVGMPWSRYIREDPWSKDAIRKAFAQKRLD